MAAATKAPAKRKATRKKAAPRKAAPKQPQTVTHEFTEEQWAALLETYTTLKTAGLPIPSEVAEPVNAWLAQQKAVEIEITAAADAEAAILAEEDAEGPKWVRNLYTSPFSLRLQRQSDTKTRRIELKPRGVRGDMFPLEDGDENDHILRANLGRVEIIGDGTAKRILAGQTHNIQKTNTTLAMITNEVGEPIKKLTVETEYNQQGVVVGYIDPNAKPKAPLGGILRPDQVPAATDQVAHFVPTGGNPAIISQGPLTDNARLAVQDKLARIKGTQGRPEEVLGLTVSVEPTRTS
jgi:hypothetical protein